MENSKLKSGTAGRTKKTAVASTTTKSTRVKSARIMPSEEEIRMKAQEIYNKRISRGQHGTPEDDWLNAERLLMG